MPRVTAQMVQQRIKNATDELLDADRKNPDQGFSAGDVEANPYRAQRTGWNGAVDKNEAAATSKTAQAMFKAGAKAWGTKVVETKVGGGWVDKAYDKQEVTGQELRRLQNLASSIVGELAGPDGNLSDEKLQNLPKLVADFWVKKYGQRDALTPDQLEAVVNLVKTAAE